MAGVRAKKSRRNRKPNATKVSRRKAYKKDKTLKLDKIAKNLSRGSGGSGPGEPAVVSGIGDPNALDVDIEESTSAKVAHILEGTGVGKKKTKAVHIPKDDVELILSMLKKYGRNYKAIAGDKENYRQWSRGQVRNLVRKLMASGKHDFLKKLPEHQEDVEMD